MKNKTKQNNITVKELTVLMAEHESFLKGRGDGTVYLQTVEDCGAYSPSLSLFAEDLLK